MPEIVGLLTPARLAQITEDIRQGRYWYVAAQRAGVNRNVMTRWLKRGEAAALARANDTLTGDPDLYEQFYESIETAKAEARASAENWVFINMPDKWLRWGYARNDWRESNHGVVEVVDELLRTMETQTAEAPPASTTDLREMLRTLFAIGAARLPAPGSAESDALPELPDTEATG